MEIEAKFLSLYGFYKNNEEAEFYDNFQRIAEVHRKMIKSFDMDNSVHLLENNSFLNTSINSIGQSVEKLRK